MTLCVLLLASLATAGEEPSGPPQVLLLHSFGYDFAPYSDFASSFRTSLAGKLGEEVDFLDVSLLEARSEMGNDGTPFVNYLMALASRRRPDIVVASGAPAVRFTQRHREQLFPGVPVIYSAVDQRTLQADSLTANDAVVAIRIDLPGLVENILQVLPRTEHVAIVLGASPLERYWGDEFRREVQPYSGRVRFTWFNEMDFEQMKKEVAKLPPNSAILYALLLVDASGVPHALDQGLRDLHAVANSPIFGIFLSHVDRGVVGGRLVSDRELGINAAGIAVRILAGEVPATLSPEPLGPGPPIYDWRELQRWGISEAALPAGSILRFREPTVWERYRSYLLAAFFALILQAALIGALVWQRVHRRRAEHETKSLGGRLLMVHENERRRVARELHDDVTQRLAALAIDAGQLEAGRQNVARDAAGLIREGLVKLSEDVHALSYRLHPSVIEDLGLVEALRAECDRVAQASSFRISFNASGIPRKLPRDVALCLFRIAQEALRNVGRHANASAVEVSIAPMDVGLKLSIHDNGSGFDMSRRADRPSLGLASMRERVNLLQGEIDIESAPGQGTTIFAWIPLPEVSA